MDLASSIPPFTERRADQEKTMSVAPNCNQKNLWPLPIYGVAPAGAEPGAELLVSGLTYVEACAAVVWDPRYQSGQVVIEPKRVQVVDEVVDSLLRRRAMARKLHAAVTLRQPKAATS